MKVILLRDIPGVGQKDDVKDISDGYAMNFLIPKKLAEPASKEKLEQREKKQVQAEAASQKKETLWAEQARLLEGARVTVRAEANAQGHLYRQLPLSAIKARIAKELGVDVPEESLSASQPIKSLGRGEAIVHLGKRRVPVVVFVERAED